MLGYIFGRRKAREAETFVGTRDFADKKVKEYDAALLQGINDEGTAQLQLAGYIPFSKEEMEAIRANETRLMVERNRKTEENYSKSFLL